MGNISTRDAQQVRTDDDEDIELNNVAVNDVREDG